ncbi:peptide-methionine (S)-S-oxide reductase MsrA [Nocardiopsis alba]|uniref:Peptide methionine sulfoxide reductase MsrA n=2 Tax=Nocardiopsis alba TaxID=53437 RepID=A0A7K2IU09_9ACTN|nr:MULTISPECIES: peptide-methionine (S)-S-oxide reductase MsrA [Nocardiopsis]MEC3894710.1 peptide-methionine (S)-S-oxide reductase MsrA [Nocardiopsis sp. LDBS1602]MYR33459.1 peptide-methionine (S)-S-oxide reductase MsrA [Nocardiopsis alba]
MFGRKTTMVDPARALPGRETPIEPPFGHTVLGTALTPPYPDGSEIADLGMGCFWGAERVFWRLGAEKGVITTAVGYAGGFTPNPTYEEVCSGLTGHTEVVRVVFDPELISYAEILKIFWEGHDPTQGMRQGNDVGSQYRSAIYYHSEAQRETAEATRDAFQPVLTRSGYGEITTEIAPLRDFYFAEDYHQQYLSDAKNPNGYCGIGGTGASCPIGVASTGDE